MAITKYGDAGVSPRTNVYAEKKMLAHAMPVTVLDKFGLPVRMPKNKTQTIKWRRPVPFAAATTALTEGVTPASTSFTYEDVSASLDQYGMVVEITDHIADTHEDPVLNDASEQAGENVGPTIEALTWATLVAGTNVFYAGGTNRATVDEAISKNLQRKVVRELKAQKARKVSKMLSSTQDYGTESIESAYICVAHTDCESDIRNIAGFIATADYGQRQTLCPEEIGAVEDVRYVLSPDLNPFLAAGPLVGSTGMVAADDTNLDVYPMLYFGKEAYATVALRGQGAISPSIIPTDTKSKADVLGQRGYVGWKTWFTSAILNDAWMCRVEVAVTDL